MPQPSHAQRSLPFSQCSGYGIAAAPPEQAELAFYRQDDQLWRPKTDALYTGRFDSTVAAAQRKRNQCAQFPWPDRPHTSPSGSQFSMQPSSESIGVALQSITTASIAAVDTQVVHPKLPNYGFNHNDNNQVLVLQIESTTQQATTYGSEQLQSYSDADATIVAASPPKEVEPRHPHFEDSRANTLTSYRNYADIDDGASLSDQISRSDSTNSTQRLNHKEREHFSSVRFAIQNYSVDALLEIATLERHFNSLSLNDRELLSEPLDVRVAKMKNGVLMNQALLDLVLLNEQQFEGDLHDSSDSEHQFDGQDNSENDGEDAYVTSAVRERRSVPETEGAAPPHPESGERNASPDRVCAVPSKRTDEYPGADWKSTESPSGDASERSKRVTERSSPLPWLTASEGSHPNRSAGITVDECSRAPLPMAAEGLPMQQQNFVAEGVPLQQLKKPMGRRSAAAPPQPDINTDRHVVVQPQGQSKCAHNGLRATCGADEGVAAGAAAPTNSSRDRQQRRREPRRRTRHRAHRHCRQPSPTTAARNVSRVRSTLRQFARDWSVEGKPERDAAYQPLLKSLDDFLNLEDFYRQHGRVPRILCPGSGLGRLPFEVVLRGYGCQGNEFSYFMLLGSNLMLNTRLEPGSCEIQPYCLSTSNRFRHDDSFTTIAIPDISPVEMVQSGGDFSMCAGEFVEVYYEQEKSWDGVLTSFFIDTAKNVLLYIRTIARILRPGGVWSNVGPLLYHFAEVSNEISIELSFDEIRQVILRWFSIVREERVEAYYTTNPQSMMQVQYHCIHFVAIRNELPVTGISNPVY